jgi:Bardet-Biedl syndrome 1 protein
LKSLGICNLSSLSQQLIFWPEEKREEFIKEHAEASLERHSTITAMTTIYRASTEPKAPSCLILATESGDLLILDTQAFTVLHQAKAFPYKTSPAIISATGQYEIDFRIIIATREGYLCILRKTWVEGQLILKLEHPATGLALLPIDQTIVVVCMDKSLICYSKKGKKLWGVSLPASAGEHHKLKSSMILNVNFSCIFSLYDTNVFGTFIVDTGVCWPERWLSTTVFAKAFGGSVQCSR